MACSQSHDTYLIAPVPFLQRTSNSWHYSWSSVVKLLLQQFWDFSKSRTISSQVGVIKTWENYRFAIRQLSHSNTTVRENRNLFLYTNFPSSQSHRRNLINTLIYQRWILKGYCIVSKIWNRWFKPAINQIMFVQFWIPNLKLSKQCRGHSCTKPRPPFKVIHKDSTEIPKRNSQFIFWPPNLYETKAKWVLWAFVRLFFSSVIYFFPTALKCLHLYVISTQVYFNISR